MTFFATKDIKNQGGMGVDVPELLPVLRLFSADVVNGSFSELSCIGNAAGAAATFVLPAVRRTGEVVGVKYLTPIAGGNRIAIATSQGDLLLAGVGSSPLTTMSLVGNVGEAAIFVSGIGSPNAWFLVSYLPGSTFAP